MIDDDVNAERVIFAPQKARSWLICLAQYTRYVHVMLLETASHYPPSNPSRRPAAQLINVAVIDRFHQPIGFRLQKTRHVLGVRLGHRSIVPIEVGNVNGNDANQDACERHRFEDLEEDG